MARLTLALLVMMMFSMTLKAQDRPVITAENAAQVQSPLYTGQGDAKALALSPDGTLLVVGTGTGVYIHNTSGLGTQTPLAYVSTGTAANDVAFSPDGTMVAMALSDGSVQVVNPLTKDSYGGWTPFENAATAVAFSPDGSQLAAASQDGKVVTFSLKDGSQVAEYIGMTGRVVWLGYDPNGPRLIGSALSGDTPFVAWDTTTQKVLYTLTIGPKAAFNTDGTLLAVPYGGESVYVLDPATGERKLSYYVSGRGTQAVGFMPDGRVVSAGGDFDIRLDDIDLSDDVDHSVKLDGHHTYIGDVVVSPDGATVYSVADDGLLIAWDVATGEIREKHQSYTGPNSVIVPLKDNNHVAIGGADGLMTVWDVESDTVTQDNAALNPEVGQESIIAMDFTPDESVVVVGTNTGFVQGFSYPDFDHLWSFYPQSPMVLEISPDGKTVAAGGGTKTLQLFPVDGSQEKPTEQDSQEGSITALHWTPNGITVMMGSDTYDKAQIYLYNVDKTTPYFTLSVPGDVYDFDFSPTTPNGDLMAVSTGPANEPFAGIYNFATDKTTPLEGSVGIVNAIVFSPDGSIILTGSGDGHLRLFETATGHLLAELPSVNSGSINDVAFSPDGTRIFSTSSDGTTCVWQVVEEK